MKQMLILASLFPAGTYLVEGTAYGTCHWRPASCWNSFLPWHCHYILLIFHSSLFISLLGKLCFSHIWPLDPSFSALFFSHSTCSRRMVPKPISSSDLSPKCQTYFLLPAGNLPLDILQAFKTQHLLFPPSSPSVLVNGIAILSG